jgi:hypothetical protein
MPANLTSRTANFFGDQTEAVTISRRSSTSRNQLNEPIWNVSAIYTGNADVQFLHGDVTIVRAGEIVTVEAELTIEPVYGQSTLVLQVGDKVVMADNSDWLIIETYNWAMPYPHTSAEMKRGAGW